MIFALKPLFCYFCLLKIHLYRRMKNCAYFMEAIRKGFYALIPLQPFALLCKFDAYSLSGEEESISFIDMFYLIFHGQKTFCCAKGCGLQTNIILTWSFFIFIYKVLLSSPRGARRVFPPNPQGKRDYPYLQILSLN